jgi:hypothetical protein
MCVSLSGELGCARLLAALVSERHPELRTFVLGNEASTRKADLMHKMRSAFLKEYRPPPRVGNRAGFQGCQRRNSDV